MSEMPSLMWKKRKTMTEVQYKLSLEIETKEGLPSMVQIALLDTAEPDTTQIMVKAANWEQSDSGAKAIASLLHEAADAIEIELGAETTYERVAERRRPGETVRDVERREQAEKRPRFNPQPRKPGAQ